MNYVNPGAVAIGKVLCVTLVLVFAVLFLTVKIAQPLQQAREREDDEIVDALNAYTAKLQKSLQIINSTEE